MASRSVLVHILFAVCFLAAVVASVVFLLLPEWRKKEELREQRDALVVTNAQISEEISQLTQRRLELESDNPDRLIKEANDKGFYAEGDVILVFPENP